MYTHAQLYDNNKAPFSIQTQIEGQHHHPDSVSADTDFSAAQIADDIRQCNQHHAPTLTLAQHHANDTTLQRLQRCLQLNQNYQQFLQTELHKINQLLDTNAEKRRLLNIRTTAKFFKNGKKAKQEFTFAERSKVFSAPFFVDIETGRQPPDNEVTVQKREYLKQKFAHLTPFLPANSPPFNLLTWKSREWAPSDSERLVEQLRIQRRQEITQQQTAEIEHEIQQRKEAVRNDTSLSLEEKEDEELSLVRECEARCNTVIERSFELSDEVLLWIENANSVDWERVATDSQFRVKRTAFECRLHWCNTLDPRINLCPFTRQEEQRMLQLRNQIGPGRWGEIAQRLGTNRTAIQCLQHYQIQLNPIMTGGKWTKEEDEKLIKLVRQYGDRNWSIIAAHLPRRTETGCLHRWHKSVNPAVKSGGWTLLEDLLLKLAVKAYDCKDWHLMQHHIPGRTDVKCRERWHNAISPSLDNSSFTAAEDARLQIAVEQCGIGNWSKIAQRMTPRTDAQCFKRWRQIQQQHKTT